MRRIFILLLMTFFVQYNYAQKVKLLSSETKSSFRGLSVVNDNTVWVSGSNGTIGKSIDGGNSWKFFVVKGFEKVDFRDIEAFDKSTFQHNQKHFESFHIKYINDF